MFCRTLVCISRAEGCYKFDMAGEPRRTTGPWNLGLLVVCNLVILFCGTVRNFVMVWDEVEYTAGMTDDVRACAN